MLSNKNLNPIVTEIFIRCRRLNITLALIAQSYFAVQKHLGLTSSRYFIMKIPRKQKLQETAFSRSSEI